MTNQWRDKSFKDLDTDRKPGLTWFCELQNYPISVLQVEAEDDSPQVQPEAAE